MDRGSSGGFLSLAYDAAMPSHRALVPEHLSKSGIRATFYLDPTAVLEDARRWKEIARSGHEMGNGCLISSADAEGRLHGWTRAMIQEEIEEAELFLAELFRSQKPHSFGYPWGTPCCTETSDYRDVVVPFGMVARSGEFGFNAPGSMDETYLLTLFASDKKADELSRIVAEAFHKGQWCIVSFRGIGEADRTMDPEEHAAFCAWVRDGLPAQAVGPVLEVAESLRGLSRVER